MCVSVCVSVFQVHLATTVRSPDHLVTGFITVSTVPSQPLHELYPCEWVIGARAGTVRVVLEVPGFHRSSNNPPVLPCGCSYQFEYIVTDALELEPRIKLNVKMGNLYIDSVALDRARDLAVRGRGSAHPQAIEGVEKEAVVEAVSEDASWIIVGISKFHRVSAVVDISNTVLDPIVCFRYRVINQESIPSLPSKVIPIRLFFEQ